MKFKEEHNIPEPVNNPKEDDAKDGPEELPEVEEDDDDVDEELFTLSGLRRQYSKSSTVQTAPFTFSTRIKHLCKLKL